MDILGLIFFCICFGAAIGTMQAKAGTTLRDFFASAFEAMMKLTGFVIRFLPIGVFGLIVTAVGNMGFGVIEQVGKYMLTIALGLTIHILWSCRRSSTCSLASVQQLTTEPWALPWRRLSPLAPRL